MSSPKLLWRQSGSVELHWVLAMGGSQSASIYPHHTDATDTAHQHQGNPLNKWRRDHFWPKWLNKALPLPRFHLLQQTLCQKCILFVKIYPTSSRVANGVAFVWTRGVVGAHMMWAHDGWGVGGLRWWCTLRLRGPGRVSPCLSPPDPRPPHWTQSTQPGRSGRCSLAVRSAQTFLLHICLLNFCEIQAIRAQIEDKTLIL